MSRYLLTGVTGYIGSMLAKKIIEQGDNVTAIVRNSNRLESDLAAKVELITSDITDREAMLRIQGEYDYLIHCAAPTKSAYMISNPVEVIQTIVNGTDHILNLARRCHIKSMVYLSSMEVYGQIDCSNDRRVTEDEMGYFDVANIRNCYPLAKIMAENLCHSYYKEYNVPVKIGRLAQTFGRGIRSDDTRVFAQFARQIKQESDIVLHTSGNSVGNYCDIDDAIQAIFFILDNGKSPECYNIVHEENTMTIRQMAELTANEITGGRIKVVYDIAEGNPYGYAAETGLRMSGNKLRKLGWEADTGILDMYRRMLDTIG